MASTSSPPVDCCIHHMFIANVIIEKATGGNTFKGGYFCSCHSFDDECNNFLVVASGLKFGTKKPVYSHMALGLTF